jgi:hypothetical protein
MAYVPQNAPIFNAAYQGAVCGSFAAGRFPSNTNPAATVQVSITAACFAYAKAYDTLRGAAISTCCEEELVRQASQGAWSTRASQSLNQADYNEMANTIRAGITAALTLSAAEAVPCPCPGAGGGSIAVYKPVNLNNSAPTLTGIAPNAYFGSKIDDGSNITTLGGTLLINVWASATYGPDDSPNFNDWQVFVDDLPIAAAIFSIMTPINTRSNFGGSFLLGAPAAGAHSISVDLVGRLATSNLNIDDRCVASVIEYDIP